MARINDEDYLAAENRLLFKELGIELMFYPEKSAADEIVNSLKHVASSDSMDFAHGKLQISVFKIDEESPMVDLRLSEFIQTMTPEETTLFRIIAISRDQKTIIPKYDTKFQYGDLVFTVSKREGLASIMKYFGRAEKSVDKVMILGGTPIAEMVAASMTNCCMIVRSLAPRALRMPISRVRSVTETSMMFMMPMPPTTREMAAMMARTTMTMFSMLVITPRSSDMLRTA